MSTPTQYPTAQVTVGGQPTVAGYEVISATKGYAKDEEDKQNANGTHRVKIQYSKRKTLSLVLEAHDSTDITAITDADEMTVDAVVYNIVSAVPTHTRGVTVVNVELIQQAEGLT
jgi:hypothetical protein